ncbi:hypothetical protein OB919_06250 [Halobacteria archaeon AArc-curdl1]|uniref:DUF6603 domain-containing protein n=1 Tax=Natronosalvus hydrolyticus TaxID=2979988 RepID=A0AAP2Z6N2_9EURY|nr:hypothetical protein [Halobacteria archaeon AArc-curdl1]
MPDDPFSQKPDSIDYDAYVPEPAPEPPAILKEDERDRSTTAIILQELLTVVDPIVVAARRGDDEIDALLADAGVDEETIESTGLSELRDAAIAIDSLVEDVSDALEGDLDPTAITPLVGTVGEAFSALSALRDIDLEAAGYGTLGDRLLDYLIITYLGRHHHTADSLFRLFGVITTDEDGVDTLDLSVLTSLPDDAGSIPAQALEWGESSFDAVTVVYYLRQFAWSVGLPGTFAHTPPEELAALADMSEPPEQQELDISILSLEYGSVGVRLVPLPSPADSVLPGLAVVPYGVGALDFGQSIELDESWTFNADLTGDGSFDGYGLSIRPGDGGLDAALAELSGAGIETDLSLLAEAALEFDGTDTDTGETTLLGNPEGSRLAIRSFSTAVSLEYEDGSVVFVVELPARGTMGVHPSDFDGFLKNVLPADGLFYDFDTTVGWSSSEGLFFERGGTLETTIPQNLSVGPVDISNIYLAALPTDGEEAGLSFIGATSATVSIGPATGTVTNIGIDGTLTFPEDGDGNLGIVDLDVGFKPPDGIGLAVDSGPVSGGGYLELDHANQRYAGAIQLHVGDLTLNAVGLLTTKLPDGSDGFSLLVLIAGEFTPIQLGFGFTLNGIGGLVGINRSIKTEPLREAVATGSLDSVLFPQNVVENAQQIVSDLRSIFPPTRGTHVFGPMARLGWGTPSLITADLGVVLEIPSTKITILGRLSAVLPDEKAPLIELNMNALGVIDPAGKTVEIDASLYESRVLAYVLSGDFALRSGWGDNPRFILSAGGFHPAYDPPGDFPELDRVRASLGKPGSKLSIELSGFFAVTTNTVQVGGKIEAKAKAGSLKAEGVIDLKALFEFDPFAFVFDFRVGFSVTYKGKGVTVKVSGRLSGPTPWRVNGKVSVDLFLFSISKRVNVTIGSAGDDDALPPADVMSKLLAELEQPGNWSAQRPLDADGLVTVREIDKTELADEDGDTIVLVHPLGDLSFRQTVVPLDLRIEVFGNARPARYTKFTIDGVAGGGDDAALELTDVVEEQFAPAQYLELTDEEKLDSPAFERHPAGRKIRSSSIYRGGVGEALAVNTRQTTLAYETIVEDRRKDNWAARLADLGHFRSLDDSAAYLPESADIALAFDEVGAVATAGSRQIAERRYARPSVVETGVITVGGGAHVVDEGLTKSVDAEASSGTGSFVRKADLGMATGAKRTMGGEGSSLIEAVESVDSRDGGTTDGSMMRIDPGSDHLIVGVGTFEPMVEDSVSGTDSSGVTDSSVPETTSGESDTGPRYATESVGTSFSGTLDPSVAGNFSGMQSGDGADTTDGPNSSDGPTSSVGDAHTTSQPSRFTVGDSRYRVVDAATMHPAPIRDNDRPLSKAAAKRALSRHVTRNPADEGRYQVVANRRVREPTTEATQ